MTLREQVAVAEAAVEKLVAHLAAQRSEAACLGDQLARVAELEARLPPNHVPENGRVPVSADG